MKAEWWCDSGGGGVSGGVMVVVDRGPNTVNLRIS